MKIKAILEINGKSYPTEVKCPPKKDFIEVWLKGLFEAWKVKIFSNDNHN